MTGTRLYDGQKHLFIPDGLPLGFVGVIAGYSTSLLQRISAVGQEPQPGVNLAPAMRVIRLELDRRSGRAAADDRAYDTAVQVHQSRRWVGPALSNFGRTA